MSNKDKKFYRKLKRGIKKDGNKRKRQWLKQQLADHPEEAHYDEFDFGNLSSKFLNGLDHDSTRHNDPPPKTVQDPWAESDFWQSLDER